MAETVNRFNSFSPVRDGVSEVKWLVDGEDYMSAVADAIIAAKREILITDYQIHPHVHLKRPSTGVTGLDWRLDKMLLEKAEKNKDIRIFILLYWETKEILWKKILDLGSEYAESALKQHDNINIIRHPTNGTLPFNWRWAHHEKVVVVDRSIAFVGGIDLCWGRWDTSVHELTDQCGRWIGKDYDNPFLDVVNGNSWQRSSEDYKIITANGDEISIRDKYPRMPWHDVSCMFSGEPALDVAKHFVQRYKYAYLSYWNLSWLNLFWHGRKEHVPIENWDHPEISHSIPDPSARNVKIQVLRSVSNWSAGQKCENSIHEAYLDAINNAEHFIYIENQFFISSQPKGYIRKAQNGIQKALSEKIFDAYKKKKPFHVMIVLPLKPGFPGEWCTESGGQLEGISYWNYATLFDGEHSLFNRLMEQNIPSEALPQYISVYGLRTHSKLSDQLVTEIIYVHSKLMTVDDKLTIIGSANINDRSMLGERDSEVDVIIEDKEFLDGMMSGKPYPVGKFSHGLRCRLMKEHLGLLSDNGRQETALNVEDPLSSIFLKHVAKTAKSNSDIYEEVFQGKIIPTDRVRNEDELEDWKTHKGLADLLPQAAEEELGKIRGHIVDFPPSFLSGYLKPSALDYFSMYVAHGHNPQLDFSSNTSIW